MKIRTTGLKDKLKSLIFIPIISQTYCDPKSFAWEHEFCAFNKMSADDQFGLDIKLSNGNVASRILPVRIHELDAQDKAFLENELGGALRAIEFIYKEPGVNRPLKVEEEMTFKLLEQALKENDVYLHVLKEFSVSMYKVKDAENSVPTVDHWATAS